MEGLVAGKPENRHERARTVIAILEPLNPNPRPNLSYTNAFQLLVATILSAQCTDAMVNRITPALFERWPDALTLAEAPIDELERMVHSTGFYREKTKNISLTSRILVERHAGEVPHTMDDLVALPGVGRKTAGVVLSACWGIPAIIVDTHFARVSRRLGFASATDPRRIETEIGSFLPETSWTLFSHLLNNHGRNRCIARLPRCGDCPLKDICPFLSA